MSFQTKRHEGGAQLRYLHSSFLMSKPIHQEIHSLYRSYLRVAREWPEDKLRPNRGMKQILAMRVKETFRKPNDEIDLNLALKEIESLEALLDNTFKDKVSSAYVLANSFLIWFLFIVSIIGQDAYSSRTSGILLKISSIIGGEFRNKQEQ